MTSDHLGFIENIVPAARPGMSKEEVLALFDNLFPDIIRRWRERNSVVAKNTLIFFRSLKDPEDSGIHMFSPGLEPGEWKAMHPEGKPSGRMRVGTGNGAWAKQNERREAQMLTACRERMSEHAKGRCVDRVESRLARPLPPGRLLRIQQLFRDIEILMLAKAVHKVPTLEFQQHMGKWMHEIHHVMTSTARSYVLSLEKRGLYPDDATLGYVRFHSVRIVGSRGCGTYTAQSDCDLLVLLEFVEPLEHTTNRPPGISFIRDWPSFYQAEGALNSYFVAEIGNGMPNQLPLPLRHVHVYGDSVKCRKATEGHELIRLELDDGLLEVDITFGLAVSNGVLSGGSQSLAALKWAESEADFYQRTMASDDIGYWTTEGFQALYSLNVARRDLVLGQSLELRCAVRVLKRWFAQQDRIAMSGHAITAVFMALQAKLGRKELRVAELWAAFVAFLIFVYEDNFLCYLTWTAGADLRTSTPSFEFYATVDEFPADVGAESFEQARGLHVTDMLLVDPFVYCQTEQIPSIRVKKKTSGVVGIKAPELLTALSGMLPELVAIHAREEVGGGEQH